MASVVPAPPPDASATVRGLMNTIAQQFSGVKEFLDGIITPGGLEAGIMTADKYLFSGVKTASFFDLGASNTLELFEYNFTPSPEEMFVSSNGIAINNAKSFIVGADLGTATGAWNFVVTGGSVGIGLGEGNPINATLHVRGSALVEGTLTVNSLLVDPNSPDGIGSKFFYGSGDTSTLILNGIDQVDGAGEIAIVSDTYVPFADVTSKLWSWKNDGVEQGFLGYNGALNVTGVASASKAIVIPLGSTIGSNTGACTLQFNNLGLFLNRALTIDFFQALQFGASGCGLLGTAAFGSLFLTAGSGGDSCKIAGVIKVNNTVTGNTGAGETNLTTYSLLASTLNINERGIKVTAWGTFAANGNTKTVKLKFGTAELTGGAFTGAYNGSTWKVTGTVIRTGAATQNAFAEWGESGGTTVGQMAASSPTETLSGAITIAVTGQGTADNDIQIKGFILEWMG